MIYKQLCRKYESPTKRSGVNTIRTLFLHGNQSGHHDMEPTP